jgi:hypothetical protein
VLLLLLAVVQIACELGAAQWRLVCTVCLACVCLATAGDAAVLAAMLLFGVLSVASTTAGPRLSALGCG